jgi:outer membrane protein OmpA-like peptidoglycan-associated protein
MSSVRASNPTSSVAPSSKSGGQSKSTTQNGRAEGTTSSDYLQQTRQDNPEPNKTDGSEAQLKLSDCKFITSPDDLGIEKEFEAECIAEWQGENPPKVKEVFFAVKMSWQDGDKLHEEDGAEEFSATLNLSNKNQTVKLKAKLPRPPSFPDAGVKIHYKLVASHSEAKSTSESSAAELGLGEPVHVFEIPEQHFLSGGSVPCLDEKGELIQRLAEALKWVSSNESFQCVAIGHSDSTGERPKNFKISQRRAQACASLVAADDKSWASAVGEPSIKELQTTLKGFTTTFGWSCDPGALDGENGPKTKKAVSRFQWACNKLYKSGLTVDGVAGPKTWKAIHRTICGLVAREIGVADPSSSGYPAWKKVSVGWKTGNGGFGCGDSFPVKEVKIPGLSGTGDRRVDLMFAKGWSFLKDPTDQSQKLDKANCKAYDDGFAEYTCLEFKPSIEIQKVVMKNQLGAPLRDAEYGLVENGNVICYGKFGVDGCISFRTKADAEYELDLLDSDDDYELESE